jgi:uncharacterized protein
MIENASSLPPRLPFLSPVLRALRDADIKSQDSKFHGQVGKTGIASSVRYIMVCVSYRGYWTSKGRPSERGMAKDAVAALKWIGSQPRDDPTRRVPVILWARASVLESLLTLLRVMNFSQER